MSLRRLALACASALAAGATATASSSFPRRGLADAPPRAATDDAPNHAPDDTEGVTYRVYDGRDGSPRTLSDIVRAALAPPPPGGAVLLLGEAHDDSIAHVVQQRLLKAVWAGAAMMDGGRQPRDQQQHQSPRPLALCLEMFERDVQSVLDEVLGQQQQPRQQQPRQQQNQNQQMVFSEEDLLRDARPWPNYIQDYRQLVIDARAHGARVVAANAPRRYVSVAGRLGAEALERVIPPGSPAREWLAPLPHQTASLAYARRIETAMRAAAEAMRAGREDVAAAAAATKRGQQQHQQQHQGPLMTPTQRVSAPAATAAAEDGGKGACPYIGFSVSSSFFDAQSLWDATMAWSISRELLRAPGSLVALVAGRFHVEQGLGVQEHLAHYTSREQGGAGPPRVVSVTVVQSASIALPPEQLKREGVLGLADFLVLSDGKVPPSFRSVHL
jgi:uncharacterized iron-regulated protein